MPGVKRKASFTAPFQRPQKLKKQSTSVSVARAIGTLRKAKSGPKSPVKFPRSTSVSPKKLSPQKSIKKPSPLPRFPTLKPTKPLCDPDTLSTVMFYGSPKTNLQSSSSFTKLKKAPTILVKENSVTPNSTKLNKKLTKKLTSKGLSKKSTVLVSTSDNGAKPSNSEGSITSAGMNSSMRKLPSGSTIGKIIKDNGLDESIMPSDVSLAVYEFSEDVQVSPALNISRSVNTPAVRQSAYDVAKFFESESPPKDEGEKDISKNLHTELTESETSVACQTEGSSVCTDSDLSPIKSVLEVKEGESPMKSPKKGLRGGVREIVFSFDTTGSMYSYMEEAREKIKEIVNRLQADIPGVRLGFLAHGDYYDLQFDRYLIKWINFGASVDEISEFFEDLGITHGGDPEECYELVLRRVQDPSYVAWTPGSQRCLVMIGDSDPHEPGYTFDGKVNEIDWRQETEKLRDMGVRIYGLQVGYGSDFYRQISKITGGAHLRLDASSFMPDVIMAICLREGNLKLLKVLQNPALMFMQTLIFRVDGVSSLHLHKSEIYLETGKTHYETEVRSRAKKEGNSLDLELERLFSALKNIEDNKAFKPNKKSPSKSPSKKVKMALESAKSEEKQTVKRTLTPFISGPSKKMKLDILSSKQDKVETPVKQMMKEKSKKVVKKTSPTPKVKTLKAPVKQKVVDRGKKVKRLGQSTKAKQVKLSVVSKATAKKKSAVGAASKQQNKREAAKDKRKSSAKAKKSEVKKMPVKGGKPAKKAGLKGKAQAKKPGTKVVKNKVMKGLGKPKAGKAVGKFKASKAKASIAQGRRNTTKTKSGKSQGVTKSSKIKVTTKVTKLAGKSNKAKSTPVKLSKVIKVLAKSGSKASEKAKTSKPSVKVSKTLAKSKGIGKLKPLKSKGNTKIKGKAAPKKATKAVAKKKNVKSAPKKVVQANKPKESRKRPAPKAVEKKAKVPKIDRKTEKPKKETKTGNSQAKGANGRLFRENVAGSNFATGPLSSLAWTQWTVFISPTKPKENIDKFIGPKGWCSGYCNNEMFKSDGIIQAVYEFAVAPPGGTKKYPVYYCATAGSSKINMKECLKDSKMKKEMDRVIKAKGTIFIRRGGFSACNLAKLKETKDYIKENFDYAWGGNDQQRRKSGDIQKDGFIIAKAFK